MGTRPLTLTPPAHLIPAFEAAFNAPPTLIVRAPGRIDLIGGHTDYNEGFVLAAAIDRAAWLAVRPLDTSIVSVKALDLGGEETVFRLTELESKKTITGRLLPDWARYAAGVAWSLQEAGLATPGSQIVLTSDIPVGAGLSSSAAVEVAYATAWAQITGWEVDRMEMAQLCQRAESRYVGVNSGLMDQFSSLFGRKDHALLLDCRTLEWEAVPLPEDVTLVVVDTGTRRELAGSHYNERRVECEQAVAALRPYLPQIQALRDVTPEQLDEYQDEIPEPARSRARHVVAENGRVQAAAAALRAGDVALTGALMNQSYTSARDLFEASGPALDAAWQAAQAHPASYGGRFIGAGWAGCLVFLVQREQFESFQTHMANRLDPAAYIYSLRAAVGAGIVPLPR
jgi:galactokinase